MISRSDFMKKQIVMVFSNNGEKLSFGNDNLIVSESDGSVKLQTTCYRISALFIVGHITITSALIAKSHKFGFSIYLMTTSFRTYDIIGHETEGHVRLRQKQYASDHLDIGKHLVVNKICNQISVLKSHRTNDWGLRECIENMEQIADRVQDQSDVHSVMGLEGNAAKLYFRHQFDLPVWNGRMPRAKTDFVNSTLDIGYTILFNTVDSFLRMYGFDTYKGVLHTCFYMRKSLVCDLVEPFRPIIDRQIRKSINLGQCRTDHFNVVDGRYLLSIEHQKDYAAFLTKPLIDCREDLFMYFQAFYRAFEKGADAHHFPYYNLR